MDDTDLSAPRTPAEHRLWWEKNSSVPYGLCWCGCGHTTPLGNWTDRRRGVVKGAPTRFLRGHMQVIKQQEKRANLPEPNPSGLCMCGCGQPAPIARYTSTSQGWVKGKPILYIQGHSHRLLTAEQEAEACRLYQSKNMTCEAIGERLSVSRHVVASALKRSGVKMRPKGWSTRGQSLALTAAQELEVCDRYLNGESGKAIAIALGISEGPVYAALKRHNIKARPSSYDGLFSKSEERLICARYLANDRIAAIADDYGVTYQAVWNLLKRNGIAIRPRNETGTKYHCDHGFFDAIDSEEKAYWLGFLAADADIGAEGRLSISLKPSDREHLYRLKYSLKSTHPVTDYTSNSGYHGRQVTFSVLDIGSSRLVRGLTLNGVGPKKTFALRWPSHLEPDMLKHFLRGMVDGDGSLTTYVRQSPDNGKFEMQYRFSLTSNTNFLKECQRYLVEACDLRCTKLARKREGNPNIGSLAYGGRRQVERIFHLLYDDANIFLLRKYYELSFHFQGAYDPEPRYYLMDVDLQKLDALLEVRGLGVTHLAKKAGLNRNIVAKLRKGKHRGRPETIAKLARALDVSPAALLTD
jgi:DNA-binding CsgD family transcriptional regulator/DNA-binding Xre family transcriptional regulator